MKKLFIICILFSLTACGSSQPQLSYTPVPSVNAYLETEKVVTPMSRNQVIAAISDCEGNNMRAVMTYTKTRVNNYLTDVVIDVNCAPRYRGLF